MPPKKLAAKKPSNVEESSTSGTIIVPDIKTNLLKYFTENELNFMLSQTTVSKNPKIPDKKITLEYIDEYFTNIYPLKLYSKNFQEDFKIAMYTLFETSLFDDMKQKERDEIIFLTTKPQVSKGIECPRCKLMATYLVDKQCRSGDEGSNVFIQCTSCNYYGFYQ